MGGWGEACTSPIDARTGDFMDSHFFSLISEGFECSEGCGEARTLPIDDRTCISIDSHIISMVLVFVSIDFTRIWSHPGQKVGQPVAACGALWDESLAPLR